MTIPRTSSPRPFHWMPSHGIAKLCADGDLRLSLRANVITRHYTLLVLIALSHTYLQSCIDYVQFQDYDYQLFPTKTLYRFLFRSSSHNISNHTFITTFIYLHRYKTLYLTRILVHLRTRPHASAEVSPQVMSPRAACTGRLRRHYAIPYMSLRPVHNFSLTSHWECLLALFVS